MYAIYGNIYHQYTQMLAYIPYMDPMGKMLQLDFQPRINQREILIYHKKRHIAPQLLDL